jgi:hypothetical protein
MEIVKAPGIFGRRSLQTLVVENNIEQRAVDL